MEWLTLGLSIIAFITSTSVAMWGWWRHRNIYDVDYYIYKGQANENANRNLKKALSSGKYTILSTTHHGGDDYAVFLGKIKK